MSTKSTPSKSSKAVLYAVIGTSLAAIAATAYFFFGPKGKAHQKHAKAWAIKMKGEVVEKLEEAREITEPVYHEIIDTVAKEFQKGKRASKTEIDSLATDLKKHWKSMSRLATAAKASAVKSMAKAVKTAKAGAKAKQ